MLIFPALIISLILFSLYVSIAKPQVPYMDSMLYLSQVEHLLKGEKSWSQIYGSGEHHGLIFPFVLLIEWIFWGVNTRITTALTGIVVAATFYYWLRSFLLVRNDIFNKISSFKTIIFTVAAGIIIVSPAAFELWTLDLGFAQLIKNLLIVLFFYQLAITRFWEKNFVCAFLFGVCGAFLILFATYGWSYPFLVAVAFAFMCIVCSEPHTRAKAATALAIMIFAQYLYVRLGQGIFDTGQHASHSLVISELVKGVLFGAGSSFIGAEAIVKSGLPATVPMLLGGLLLSCVGVALVRAFVAPSPVRIFAATLLVFSLAVLAGVTLARGTTNYLNTGASRYFVDYVWFVLAPLLILTKPVDTVLLPTYLSWFQRFPLPKLYDLARLVMSALFAIALIGHLQTWRIELKAAPYRAEIFKAMASVYRQGVTSEADANLLQSPYEVARKGVDVTQRYNLTVLRAEASPCTLHSADYKGDWYTAAQDGSRWMGKQATITVSRCANPVSLKAYIPEYFATRSLRISYDGQTSKVNLEPGKSTAFTLENSTNRRIQIQLSVDATTNPAAQGISADGRDLGMLLIFIGY